jgi:hypothetical protein
MHKKKSISAIVILLTYITLSIAYSLYAKDSIISNINMNFIKIKTQIECPDSKFSCVKTFKKKEMFLKTQLFKDFSLHMEKQNILNTTNEDFLIATNYTFDSFKFLHGCNAQNNLKKDLCIQFTEANSQINIDFSNLVVKMKATNPIGSYIIFF